MSIIRCAEEATRADDDAVARLDQVDQARFHSGHAGGTDWKGERVLGQERGAQELLRLLHDLQEGWIEVAQEGRGHGREHTRMDVARARAEEQALRRVELTGDDHGLVLRKNDRRYVTNRRLRLTAPFRGPYRIGNPGGSRMAFRDEFARITQLRQPLAPFTHLRIGGPAEFLVTPRSRDELARVVAACVAEKIPLRVLGIGTNLLVRDDGVPGVVVRLTAPEFTQVAVTGKTVKAGGGATLYSRSSARPRLPGSPDSRHWSGITATLGGAPAVQRRRPIGRDRGSPGSGRSHRRRPGGF